MAAAALHRVRNEAAREEGSLAPRTDDQGRDMVADLDEQTAHACELAAGLGKPGLENEESDTPSREDDPLLVGDMESEEESDPLAGFHPSCRDQAGSVCLPQPNPSPDRVQSQNIVEDTSVRTPCQV